MATSVYWIHHPDHTDMFSQGYIGVSNDTERRFTEHIRKKQNRHLNFAIKKHGWDNLVKKTILIADESYCLDIESKLRPSEAIGWNIICGGGKPPIRYGNKDRLGMPSVWKGKNLSAEHCQKLSESHLGKSPANKGQVGKQVAWNKGKKWSEETKQKMSESRRGILHSDETKAKMSADRMGKCPYTMNDEVKEKIRKTLLAYNAKQKAEKLMQIEGKQLCQT